MEKLKSEECKSGKEENYKIGKGNSRKVEKVEN